MSVGRQPTKATLDAEVANLAAGLLNILAQAQQRQVWLAAVTDGDLTALTYSTDDVYLLRLIYTKLNELAAFTAGGPAPTEQYDLRAELIKVAGLLGG